MTSLLKITIDYGHIPFDDNAFVDWLIDAQPGSGTIGATWRMIVATPRGFIPPRDVVGLLRLPDARWQRNGTAWCVSSSAASMRTITSISQCGPRRISPLPVAPSA